MKEFIIVQHCQSEQHVNGMVGSWTDWPLTELGKRQANEIGVWLAERLPQEEPMDFVSSDLMRTAQTAQIVAGHMKLPVRYDKQLRELHYGDALGKSLQWYMEHKAPAESAASPVDYKPFPNAESQREIYARAEAFWASYLPTAGRWNIISSHGAMVEALVFSFLRLGADAMAGGGIQGEAGGVTFLEENNGRRFMRAFADSTGYARAK